MSGQKASVLFIIYYSFIHLCLYIFKRVYLSIHSFIQQTCTPSLFCINHCASVLKEELRDGLGTQSPYKLA